MELKYGEPTQSDLSQSPSAKQPFNHMNGQSEFESCFVATDLAIQEVLKHPPRFLQQMFTLQTT